MEPNSNGRILIVDDEANMCQLLETDLRLRGFRSAWRTSAGDAIELVKTEDFDVVLTDLRMRGMSGTELCERICANRPDIPVIVMTAFGSLETAVAAIRAGAYDFVTKPIEMELLAITLARAVRHRQLQEKVKLLSEGTTQDDQFQEMIGRSPVMTKLYDQISRISTTEAAVLVCGESGTGKELVAQSIHRLSNRRNGPFVPVNCAALPEALLESELFGHAKGAFTDAKAERRGLFLQAESGTLFLDEIGELPLAMQPKLLRALEESRVRPVGGDQEVPFDVRLVTATNRDLLTEVEEGRFREDLFYRINVIQLDIPPLRARGTDTLLLAQRFVDQAAKRSHREVVGISDPAAERLLNYSWPGNVRELRNIMERAVALTPFDKVAVDDLPEKIRDYRSSQVFIGGDDPSELVPLQEVERRYILHVLGTVENNKTLAAQILGLDRKTLYRKLKQYGVSD
ncbi:sigma-54-dependent Fis family transcriptional regulator [Blastopirellula marina]|uniref:Sigma-54-dependent Fis family transcriptional regulator n=1 Tax=Blastopirellula marina TaxID=124 RepID=A0A2S8G5G5_9BACT|nr:MULTISPECIES: sigma-54 dependent transcriptional regulator [Pirellulaceae]PQO39394.1 sigma-54-dependent Fis family transcriptional regulator [Blastopirellula marina]RCS55702.1 sigma-54-dependent Fis family transcriptional regulator [Bremerella cremea]